MAPLKHTSNQQTSTKATNQTNKTTNKQTKAKAKAKANKQTITQTHKHTSKQVGFAQHSSGSQCVACSAMGVRRGAGPEPRALRPEVADPQGSVNGPVGAVPSMGRGGGGFPRHLAGSKNRYQNGSLVSRNMDPHLRNPSGLIWSHTHLFVC